MSVCELNRKLLAAVETKLKQTLLRLNTCKSEESRNACKSSLARDYNERGLLRYKRIDFAEAIDDYTKAIEYDDHFASAYYNRGVVNYRMGCFKKAVADFEKAVNLEPNNCEFQAGLSATRDALVDSKQ